MVLHEGIRHLKTTKSSVEDKLHDICKELWQNKPHWRNLSAIDCEKLSQKKMRTLRVLDTNENLRPALVLTDWVKQLNDKQSYSIITYEDWILIHGHWHSREAYVDF